MLFNGNHDLLTSGQCKYLSSESLSVEIKPLRNGTSCVRLDGSLDLFAFLALILDSDLVACLDKGGRNVDLLAV